MPIELRCSGCQALLPVPEKFAGKRVKCPQCQAVLDVPGIAGGAAPGSAPVPLRDLWYLKTEDGEDYGPVPKAELDNWLAEGRITADCQILQDGHLQWQWANDVYPQLKRQVAPAADPPGPRGTPLPGSGVPNVPMSSPGSAATPRAEAAVEPDAFSFAARDSSPVARLRGRGRPAKKSSQRPAAKAAGPAAQAAAPRAASQGDEASAAAATSDKSRIVAGLLGLFLGFLGVHRFYLGYPLWGVLFLLTGGGFVLGALADAVLILMGHVTDRRGRPLR